MCVRVSVCVCEHDLRLNNLQKMVCHKTQQTNQISMWKMVESFFTPKICQFTCLANWGCIIRQLHFRWSGRLYPPKGILGMPINFFLWRDSTPGALKNVPITPSSTLTRIDSTFGSNRTVQSFTKDHYH